MLKDFIYLISTILFCLLASISGRELLQGTGRRVPEKFAPSPFSCAFQGQFPYVVSVRTSKNEHLCGGIVIAKNAVLTAAHCVDPRATNEAVVKPQLHLGGVNSATPVEKRDTLRAFPHPGWTGTLSNGNDLVVLKFDKETCLKVIPTLGAKDAQAKDGLWFLGYGRTAERGSFPGVLQGSQLDTLNTKACNKRYSMKPEVTKDQLCARGQTTVGMCSGDDGSPLVRQPTVRFFKDIVVGIASRASAGCTESEGAAVFMDIYKYRKWILDLLESDDFKKA